MSLLTLGIGAVWAALSFISLVVEMETSYRTVAAAYEKQNAWAEDCLSVRHRKRYESECAASDLRSSLGSFWSQWLSVAFDDVRWCGVSQCGVLLTPKNMLFAVVLAVVYVKAPAVAERAWVRMNNTQIL